MSVFLFILMIIAMIGLLATLGMGLYAMVRGGTKERAQQSNKFMQYRVIIQAIVLALFLLILYLSS